MAGDFWLDPEELRIYRAFDRSWRALMIQLDRDLEQDVGLPRTYFDILWRLRRAPERAMRMTDLAAETGSKASRMTHAIGRLEADGLVRREHAAGDRRSWMAVLTEQGLVVVELAAPRFARSVRERFLDSLSPTMRDQLVAIGETMLRELDPTKLDNPEMTGETAL